MEPGQDASASEWLGKKGALTGVVAWTDALRVARDAVGASAVGIGDGGVDKKDKNAVDVDDDDGVAKGAVDISDDGVAKVAVDAKVAVYVDVVAKVAVDVDDDGVAKGAVVSDDDGVAKVTKNKVSKAVQSEGSDNDPRGPGVAISLRANLRSGPGSPPISVGPRSKIGPDR